MDFFTIVDKNEVDGILVENEKIHQEAQSGCESDADVYGIFCLKGFLLFFKKNIRKVIAIFMIIVIAICLIILGVTIYRDTDAYKIKRATELLAEDRWYYIDEIEAVYNIDTPEAIVISNFIDVEKARGAFEDAEGPEEFTSKYKAFESALNYFDSENSIEFLPEKLQVKYYRYRTAFDFVNEYTDESGGFSEALYDSQVVMLNEVELNNSSKGGDYVTLSDLQSRVDTSNAALAILENELHGDYISGYDVIVDNNNVELYCETEVVPTGKGEITVVRLDNPYLDSLISICSDECVNSQNFIDEQKLEYGMYDELYKTNPKDDYSAEMDDLESIDGYDDISSNVDIILQSMRASLVYELIH